MKAIRIIGYIFLTTLILLVVLFFSFRRGDIAREQLIERYQIEESQFLDITIDQDITIQIHYAVFGEEHHPVVVLLHGMFSSMQTFFPWKDTLVEAGYQVVLIDLPNHGLSTGFSDQTTSLSRSSVVVDQVLQTLEITDVIIGGNSMGGGVSWFYASEYHKTDNRRILGIVLIDAVYPTLDNRANQDSIEATWITKMATQMTPKWLFRLLLQGAYGSSTTISNDTVIRYYELLRMENRRHHILTGNNESLPIENALTRLQFIKDEEIPVLLLWGKEDSWISVEFAFAFQETLSIPNNYMHIYETLGHVPMEEDPELTILDVLSFLEDIG